MELNVGTYGDAFAGAPAGMAARLLKYNFDVERALRVNSPLPVDAQKLLDNTFVTEFSNRLQVTRDLFEENLIFRVDRPFAFTEIEHHVAEKLSGATAGRFPESRTEHQEPSVEPIYTPIYYVWADFSLSVQQIEASRNRGLPLDTNLLRQKARNIAEAIEESIINGTIGGQALPSVSGRTAYGFLNFPDTQSVALSNNKPWDDAEKTVDDILEDVRKGFNALDTVRAFGPTTLYIPTSWMNAIRFKRNANTDRTALEFLQALTRSNTPLRIRESDMIQGAAIMFVRSTDVVDLIVGNFGPPMAEDDPNAPDTSVVPVTTIPWTSGDGLRFHWKLIACIVPRPKKTYSGKCGIVTIA